MKCRATTFLLAIFLLHAPRAAAQQVIIGRFCPEKHNYLVGEPIIVDFEIVNRTSKPSELGESGCPSLNRWRFEVEGATPKKKTPPFTCIQGPTSIICPMGARQIPAHGKYVQRLLLDGPFLLNAPGTYHVRAKFDQDITTWSTSQKFLTHLLVDSGFDVILRVPQKGELEAAYQPLLHELKAGNDYEIRAFAAAAISQDPPDFSEAAITELIGDPVLTGMGLEGLGRLATPTARAKLMEASTIGPEEFRQPAIKALGEAGNPEDCHAMLDIASKNNYYTRGEAYMYAARLCKEQAVPALMRVLPNADAPLSGYLAVAFENTMSRNAIPPLINLLANADQFVRQGAEESLTTLTHRKSQYGVASAESASKSRVEWSNWWATNGSTAPIYGPDQCVAPEPIAGN